MPTLDVTRNPVGGRAKGGGEGGIRTHGAREGSTVFETARFNRSRTSPKAERAFYVRRRWQPKTESDDIGGRSPCLRGQPDRLCLVAAVAEEVLQDLPAVVLENAAHHVEAMGEA